MAETPYTLIDIIRHGEPLGGKRYRGQIDDPLSDKGWQQMRDAVADYNPWQVIVTSPLVRCAAFAEELANRHDIPLEFEDRLKEIRWGQWEGSTPAELNSADPLTVARAMRDPLQHRPSDAEDINAFRQRIVDAWQDIAAKHRGKHVLIVAHAGVVRAVLTHLLQIPVENMFRIHVANASITRIQIDLHDDEPFVKLLFHGNNLPSL
jgi:alpha-ribazole phosphatase/probable phosphoglycerate mutase